MFLDLGQLFLNKVEFICAVTKIYDDRWMVLKNDL